MDGGWGSSCDRIGYEEKIKIAYNDNFNWI